MLPAWRLATSTLSTRRSRTALLTTVVALSAALIAAVACTMNSMQASARKQVASTVGTADLRIKAAGAGKTLTSDVLERARAWPEVSEAVGRISSPISVSIRLPTLMAADDGTFERRERKYMVNSVASAQVGAASDEPYTLAEGRPPAAADEIVIDASLAVRLSFRGAGARSPMELPPRRGGVREHLSGPHPALPERAGDAEEARRHNELVGVRIGDEIEVARSTLPQINVSAALADPAKAAELAKAAGVGSALAGLFQKPVRLKVVGISTPPPFGGRPRSFLTAGGLAEITRRANELTQVELTLRPGARPDEVVAARKGDLPEGLVLETTAKITGKLDQNIEASRLGFLLATAMAFLCAAFIITTGMSTGVTERLRELGVLRCIGAERSLLARIQLASGLFIGGLGAIIGVPLGLLLAFLLIRHLQTQVEVTLHVPIWGLAMAGGGALLCGLIGAAFPAWKASRVTPLQALAIRAEAPRRAGVLKLLVGGLLLASAQLATVTLTTDGQWRFWLYVFAGLPALFAGFFALSVPVMSVVTRLFAAPVSFALRLPPRLLARTLAATPYRYGFTAGSMMMGMALMLGVWTQADAIQRDWLGKLEFPDAFVTGLNLRPESQELVNQLPTVARTCAITIHPVETDAFGVRALQTYKSTFMAFEPEAFFSMAKPVWIQGDETSAVRRLNEGGAVIVAREFMVARGLGLGDTLTVRDNGKEFTFEIVGVVTSPGLEVVSQFFSIGEDFTDQSLHAMFGSRRDLKEKFGSDAIHLIQIAFKPGVNDTAAVAEIRELLAGAGILDAGSGRAVKEQINDFISSARVAMSTIAIVAMLIAGLGVANLIIAGINARQFEFGVLEAVGAPRSLVVRLVLAEALLVGVTAALVGSWMGVQGVYAVQRIDEKLFGLTLQLRPPPVPIAIGWAITIFLTLAAAAPAALAIGRKRPRELLSAIRG